jgi:cell division protein ZapA
MHVDKVTIQIYGESYSLKAGGDPAYIKDVAAFVDEKMREISSGGKAITTDKVAMLAALNIADELFKSRREWALSEEETDKKVGKLLKLLQEAFDD